MGICWSAQQRLRDTQIEKSPGVLPDEVNRLLDKWAIGHVLIIRKRFVESKPADSAEIDLVGFRHMFSELDQTLPKAVVSAAFKQFDTKGSGTLAFRDICFGLATSCISSWEVRAKFMFSWFGRSSEMTREEAMVFLTSVVSAVRHAVEYGDSGLRLPNIVHTVEDGSMEFHAKGLSSPVRERSLPEMELERIQSCVTAVQSEVYSAIMDTRSSNPGHDHPDIDLTENEKAWIDSECEALMGDALSIKFEDHFLPWSIRNCHYLYKLLELFEIVPSPERERRTCLSLLKQASFSPGSTWYVFSYKWIQLWRSYVHWTELDSLNTVWSHQGLSSPTASPRNLDFANIMHTMSTMDAMSCTSTVIQLRMAERPTAINNSDLEGELKGALKANLVEHHDYVLVPEDMWRHLTEWYGGGPAFPRKVTSFKIRKLSSMMSSSLRHIPSSAIELYPPLILVVMCGERGLPVRHFTKRFFVSRQDSCGDLIAQLARKLVNKDDPSVCRLWHRQSGQTWELILPDDPRRIDDFVGSVTTEAGTFMIEVMGRNGSWPRDKVAEQDTASHAMNELQVGDRVDAKSHNEWRQATVVDVGTDGSVKVHFDNEQYKNDAWLNCDSDEIAPAGTHAQGTGGRKGIFKKPKKIAPIKPVASGLDNIGNTCFMNATLQCLSSTPMLKEYFISNEFQKHMRVDQKVAGEFASLLSAMVKSSKGYVAPTAFKKALEKYAPRFVGYEHQDAHELLAVLLDGLHEDLNVCPERTEKKAAVNEGQDAGETEWLKHRSKHTSVIADLFDGQQQIVTECKTCHYASSMFEAFRYVMLPVPVTEYRKLSISLVLSATPTCTRPVLLKFSVLVHKAGLIQSAINTLASQHPELARNHKIDWDHGLVLAEVYMSRIHRFIDSSSQVSEFRSEDKLFAFQIESTQSSRGVSIDINLSSSLVISSSVSNTVVGSPAVVHAIETEPTGILQFFAQIVHRREVVFKRPRKSITKREVFGLPLVVAINPRWTGQQLFAAVKSQLQRFLSPSAPRNSSFVVRMTSPDGSTCSGCGKASCLGCTVLSSSTAPIRFKGNWLYLAVDWVNPSFYDPVAEIPTESSVRPEAKPSARTRTSGVCHLYDCLDAYTATENLSGDNQWLCEKCNAKSDADRRIAWHVAPDVLVVLLKRFQFTHAGFEKIGVPITFPVSDLELRTAGDQETYDLYGVVNHYGSLSSGHYTAMCRREESGWFLFNDRRVVSVPAEEVAQEIQNCAKSCYVLFYKRRGTRPANLINYTFPSAGST